MNITIKIITEYELSIHGSIKYIFITYISYKLGLGEKAYSIHMIGVYMVVNRLSKAKIYMENW